MDTSTVALRAQKLRRRRAWAISGSVGLLALSVVVGFWMSSERMITPVAAPRAVSPAWEKLRSAPRFQLSDDQNHSRSLSELAGQVVVVHFWASWCAPCLEEVPKLREAAQSFAGKPITFVAVSLDTDWKDAHRFMKPGSLPANMISVLDPKNETAEKFGTYQLPETYVLTPDLRILKKWVGPQPWESPDLRGFLTAVLKEVAP